MPSEFGNQGIFSVGDRVLVPHTDKSYEAKILKIERRSDGRWYYFLHYNGWNKKYDEWVESSITRSIHSTNDGQGLGTSNVKLALQKKLIPKEKFPRPSLSSSAIPLDLEMPLNLKKVLLDDYDANCSDGKSSPLPRHPSICDALSRYVDDYVSENGSETLVLAEEVSAALRLYFDRSVLHTLLYRGERTRAIHALALAPNMTPSAVFGCEHLLRLIVQLPTLLAAAAPAVWQTSGGAAGSSNSNSNISNTYNLNS
eukprot:CAMPEP_0175042500 /NCGR_PEP_ID=MMETSP0052_2-20121109/2605_1 /TAXON_ID=51329 ORGANISM="Polytomella parva, Strain SAG 63-3" /NCGR_SAMPLE_ID=MMETSP0052_2 /ASSEMBLY_ACC=CAM_ASM_000194 /LENGTH=255 /DNA_ID=CAMNT_0016305333 /DNA_START=172 /DNA_END=936 /DNA_ORIENTATION=+